MIRHSGFGHRVHVIHRTMRAHLAALKKYRPDAIFGTFHGDHESIIILRPTWGPGQTMPTTLRAIESAARIQADEDEWDDEPLIVSTKPGGPHYLDPRDPRPPLPYDPGI